jgi:hypothetical protein
MGASGWRIWGYFDFGWFRKYPQNTPKRSGFKRPALDGGERPSRARSPWKALKKSMK